MTVELRDLIADLAVQAMAMADSTLSGLLALSAAGAPNGIDPGPLVVGAGAGGALGGGSVVGGGSSQGGGAGSDVPRIPDRMDEARYRAGHTRFRDSSGNSYFPGISPVPSDGVVDRTIPRHPNRGGDYVERLPVNPVTGRPVFPPGSQEPTERPTAATVAGGRG